VKPEWWDAPLVQEEILPGERKPVIRDRSSSSSSSSSSDKNINNDNNNNSLVLKFKQSPSPKRKFRHSEVLFSKRHITFSHL
jgi:hypothetical protein